MFPQLEQTAAKLTQYLKVTSYAQVISAFLLALMVIPRKDA